MSRRTTLGLAAAAVSSTALDPGLPGLRGAALAATAVPTSTPTAGAWKGVTYAQAAAALADRGIIGCDPDSWATTGAPPLSLPAIIVGNGADQTAELQAAVDSVGLVTLIGTVLVSKTVTVTRSDLTIEAGKIVSSAPGAVLQITGASNVLIQNLSLVMPTKGAVAVQASKCSELTVRGLSVTMGRIFASVGANDRVRVTCCRRIDTTPFSDDEFQAGYFGAGVDVGNCSQFVVSENAYTGYADGLRFTGASSGSIFGNRITRVGNEAVWCTKNPQQQFYLCAGGIWAGDAAQVLVFGNYIDGIADVGVDFEGCADCGAFRNEVWNCNNAELSGFSCNRDASGTAGFNTNVVFDGNYAAINGRSTWVRRGSGSYLAWPKMAYDGSAESPAVEGGDMTLRNNTFTAVNTVPSQVPQVWTPVSGGTLIVSGNVFVDAQLSLVPLGNSSLASTGARNSVARYVVTDNTFTLSDVAARRLQGPPIMIEGAADSVVNVTGNVVSYAGAVCERSIAVNLSNSTTSAASTSITRNRVEARPGRSGQHDVYISWRTASRHASPPRLIVRDNTLTAPPAVGWAAPQSAPPKVSASSNATESGTHLALRVKRVPA